MRYIRYASIAIFAVALILVAMANRAMVTLKVIPDELAHLAVDNPSFQLPLFVVILGGILLGLIIGFIWEWIREAKERSEAARQTQEMQRLKAEIKRLKGDKHQNKDEVLAILDEAS